MGSFWISGGGRVGLWGERKTEIEGMVDKDWNLKGGLWLVWGCVSVLSFVDVWGISNC